jgi:hypothetical protein
MIQLFDRGDSTVAGTAAASLVMAARLREESAMNWKDGRPVAPRRRPLRRRAVAVMAAVVAMLAIGGIAPGATAVAGTDGAADNECRNPVLASDLSGWGRLDAGQVSRTAVTDLPGADWAFATTGDAFYMPELSVSPWQTWTFSAMDRVLGGTGTVKIGVDWYGADGRYLGRRSGPSVVLPASTDPIGIWTGVSATFTVPSGATRVHVVQVGAVAAAGSDTQVLSTMCDYERGYVSQVASIRYAWGTADPIQSDEYNGSAVDLSKWGLFGAGIGEITGCSPGLSGNGLRCASQTTEGGGYLSVTGTADGVTGGLWSRQRAFRYGRVEVRERAVPLSSSGQPYIAVPLLWPANDDYTHGEIDFAERAVGDPTVKLFVHHDGTQTSCSFATDSTQFHNYAIDWEPTSVTWYVDGVQVCVVNASIISFANTNGGAQLDMDVSSGPMQPARQDIDWIHMFPVSATEYQ